MNLRNFISVGIDKNNSRFIFFNLQNLCTDSEKTININVYGDGCQKVTHVFFLRRGPFLDSAWSLATTTDNERQFAENRHIPTIHRLTRPLTRLQLYGLSFDETGVTSFRLA